MAREATSIAKGCETIKKNHMKLLAFQISNFRSIAHSDWIPFSPDGITILVGQNESGKSSVLDALYCGLSNVAPTEDDFRTSAPLPNVNLRVEVTAEEITNGFGELSLADADIIANYVQQKSGTIEVNISWKRKATTTGIKYEMKTDCIDDLLKSILEENQVREKIASPQAPVDTAVAPASVEEEEEEEEESDPPLSSKLIARVIWNAIPLAVPFNEETGRLPNTVDIDEKGNPTGPGAKAAMNFLAIADVNLPELLKDDKRARENKLLIFS
ncbi:MAG: hypothetical protein CFE41_16705 [Burkholderiales bacterium PBB2]|nr:MAG: hypothetical protein CFE41_16705 [Burkholderiales bacterium PBB2]